MPNALGPIGAVLPLAQPPPPDHRAEITYSIFYVTGEKSENLPANLGIRYFAPGRVARAISPLASPRQ